jgi:acetyl esterase/lipase
MHGIPQYLDCQTAMNARVVVPYHQSVPELLAKLATSTFGDLCTWVHDSANILIATAQRFAPETYAVIGDSLGGFISLVAAQRDRRISHCILLSCSGDFCDAMMRQNSLNPALGLLAGNFSSRSAQSVRWTAAGI